MKTSLFFLILLSSSLAACGGRDAADTAEAPHAEDHAEEREEAAPRVALTEQQLKGAGIELATVGAARIQERLPIYGVVAPNAERMREVVARFPGAIRSVSKRIGDAVKEGEVLATVESNESLQTYPVTSPLAGVVTARHANPGEQTDDVALFTVADLSTVWVELSLFPRDAAKVRLGQPVRVTGADAAAQAEGKVIYVAPFGSASSQTLTARVSLDNADRRWSPGLHVTAEVVLASAEAPLAVASQALQTLEQREVVFVRAQEGFEPRPVQLGRSDGDFVEILSGLEAGEVYAARNSFILKAEMAKGEAEHAH